jgi:hypothetical protein
MKKNVLIKIIVVILIVVITLYFLSVKQNKELIENEIKYCDDYSYPQTNEIRDNCVCPEGKIKGDCLSGSYCATNSQIPCDSIEDCPEGESCTSADGETWTCTGMSCGCYHSDPENPDIILCAD